jgi:hypothetical protein
MEQVSGPRVGDSDTRSRMFDPNTPPPGVRQTAELLRAQERQTIRAPRMVRP